MEITQKSSEGRFELQLKGRFDANWADHVAKAIEAAIRAGHHHIDLDLRQVSYLSSAGIRVMAKYFKQLKGVRGAVRVVRPSDAVLSTLQLCGLADMLIAAPAAPPPAAAHGGSQRWQSNGVSFEA